MMKLYTMEIKVVLSKSSLHVRNFALHVKIGYTAVKLKAAEMSFLV